MAYGYLDEKGFFAMIKKLSVIVTGAALIVMMLVATLAQESTQVLAKQKDTLELASQQWSQLWELGQKLTSEPTLITIKWQGAYRTSLTLDEASSKLGEKLGMSVMHPLEFQGHEQYTATKTVGQTKINFTVTDQENGTYYVMVRLETKATGDVAAITMLEKLQQELGAGLIQAGITPKWNGAIQGELDAIHDQGEVGTQEDAIMKLETIVQDQWKQVTVIDRYQDLNTSNATYEVGALPLYIESGQQRLNLQLAVHYNSVSDKPEVSIGSPLLTVEY